MFFSTDNCGHGRGGYPQIGQGKEVGISHYKHIPFFFFGGGGEIGDTRGREDEKEIGRHRER